MSVYFAAQLVIQDEKEYAKYPATCDRVFANDAAIG